jgi:hypothetical protein
MKVLTIAAAALVGMLSAGAARAQNPANECLIGIQDQNEVTLADKSTTACTDGDPSCDADGVADGTCTFRLRGCVNIPGVSGCELRPMKKVRFVTPNSNDEFVVTPVAGEASSVCSAFIDFHVPLKKKGKRPGKRKINAIAKADVKPFGQNKDKDKTTYVCNPSEGGPGTTTSTTLAGCDNTAGGPDRLRMTIVDNGTDLDNGWSGNSHNFPLVPNGYIDVCLSECDSAGDTMCTANGNVGEGSPNGTQFGAPLPLFASNVPVCVVSRWAEPITGTVDEATGDTSFNIHLFSDVFLTDRNSVCPQCKNGRCNSGKNSGQSCTVEAEDFPVYVSSTQTDLYDLSSTCVPNAPTATLKIDFVPLTSGQANPLTGPTPCTRQQGDPVGVPPQPDACGGSGCGATCTGVACVTTGPDPTNPGSQICIDSKGGLSQMCCNNNTQRPCFPLAGGGQVIRTGNITVPQPPLPDTTYPKTNSGVLAATFCIPATGTNTIDSVTGLPGPGAILLNGTGVWSKD